MSFKKTEFLKIANEHKYLKEALDEYILVSGNSLNEYIEYKEIFEILHFHIFEILEIDYAYHIQYNNVLYVASREEYGKIWLLLEIQNYLIDFYNSYFYRNTTGCQVVKNYPTMIYCLTLSPPLDVSPNDLYKVVKQIIKLSGCEISYGVFEVGRTRKNFHTHIILKGKTKDFLANLKKKISKLGWINKIDFMDNPVKLLTTLRYFHSEGKDNKGIICETNFDYFITLTKSTAKKYCQTTEYENRIWNI